MCAHLCKHALQGSPDDDGQERKISSDEILYSTVALGCMFVLTYVLMNATYGIGAGRAQIVALPQLHASCMVSLTRQSMFVHCALVSACTYHAAMGWAANMYPTTCKLLEYIVLRLVRSSTKSSFLVAAVCVCASFPCAALVKPGLPPPCVYSMHGLTPLSLAAASAWLWLCALCSCWGLCANTGSRSSRGQTRGEDREVRLPPIPTMPSEPLSMPGGIAPAASFCWQSSSKALWMKWGLAMACSGTELQGFAR